jgi:hypothetical protein
MKNKNTSQIQTYEKLQGLGPASDRWNKGKQTDKMPTLQDEGGIPPSFTAGFFG